MSAQKGHDNYYDGKSVSRIGFCYVFKKVLTHELSMEKAGRVIGVSRYTMSKWFVEAAKTMDKYGNIDFDQLDFIKDPVIDLEELMSRKEKRKKKRRKK